MARSNFKVCVVGGGPAGMTAAIVTAQAGCDVTLVDPMPARARAEDPRTVALMRPAIRLLDNSGVWNAAVESRSAALKFLRLVDDTNAVVAASPVVFDADELADGEPFGWNIPLAALIPRLVERCQELGVALMSGAGRRVVRGDGGMEVIVEGKGVFADVVIAADGRNSAIRDSVGIGTVEWAYDQVAVVARFAHSQAHGGVSHEFHKPEGVFTTVPLPGNRSSLVWLMKPGRAGEVMALDGRALGRRLQVEMHGCLGAIADVSEPGSFAMAGLTANRFAKRGVYLIGEAAHVAPPIGAQGLNMSLRDAALIGEMMEDARDFGDDPASASMASAYDRRRRSDIVSRQGVIHAVNSVLLSGSGVLNAMRAGALEAIASIAPLRKRAMREGLAPAGPLPRAMRS